MKTPPLQEDRPPSGVLLGATHMLLSVRLTPFSPDDGRKGPIGQSLDDAPRLKPWQPQQRHVLHLLDLITQLDAA